MPRNILKTTAALAAAGALVLLNPLAAQAVVTVQLGGRTCGAAGAPYVHITTQTRGTVTHYHHRTGSPTYNSSAFVNSSFTTRVSSKNYTSEVAMYFTVSDGGQIGSYATSCDN